MSSITSMARVGKLVSMQAAMLLILPFATLPAQDAPVVMFEGVTCTHEQHAAGGPGSPDGVDSASMAHTVPPRYTGERPEFRFWPVPGHTPPYSVKLSFVIDTTGYPDLCTVRVVEGNEPRWTRYVLERLPGVRYRPAVEDGRPRRMIVTQVFDYVGFGRRGDG